MVELIILACLLREPSHCEAFQVPFMPGMTAVQCLYRSAIQAAQWTAEHPDWVIRKMSCGLPNA